MPKNFKTKKFEELQCGLSEKYRNSNNIFAVHVRLAILTDSSR